MQSLAALTLTMVRLPTASQADREMPTAEPSLYPYLLASGLVLAAVLAIAVLQALHASRLNPVDALRQE